MVSNSTNNALTGMTRMYVVQEIAKTKEIKYEKCGAYSGLEFHHLKYYEPGNNVTPEDIQLLCSLCHRNTKVTRSKLETIFKDGKRFCMVGTYYFEY